MVKQTINKIDEQIQKLEQKKEELMKKREQMQQKGKKYVIVRTYSAGVFAGELFSRNGKEAIVKNARRLWYWKGASSLSQLSIDGVASPKECKFPVEVPEVLLTEVIEILPLSEKARKSIQGVEVWKQ